MAAQESWEAPACTAIAKGLDPNIFILTRDFLEGNYLDGLPGLDVCQELRRDGILCFLFGPPALATPFKPGRNDASAPLESVALIDLNSERPWHWPEREVFRLVKPSATRWLPISKYGAACHSDLLSRTEPFERLSRA